MKERRQVAAQVFRTFQLVVGIFLAIATDRSYALLLMISVLYLNKITS